MPCGHATRGKAAGTRAPAARHAGAAGQHGVQHLLQHAAVIWQSHHMAAAARHGCTCCGARVLGWWRGGVVACSRAARARDLVVEACHLVVEGALVHVAQDLEGLSAQLEARLRLRRGQPALHATRPGPVTWETPVSGDTRGAPSHPRGFGRVPTPDPSPRPTHLYAGQA